MEVIKTISVAYGIAFLVIGTGTFALLLISDAVKSMRIRAAQRRVVAEAEAVVIEAAAKIARTEGQ